MKHQMDHSVLELLINREVAQSEGSAGGVRVGVLVGVGDNGEAMVAFDTESADQPLIAERLVVISTADIGRRVCLVFENGDRLCPIILGVVQEKKDVLAPASMDTSPDAKVDGEQVIIEGKKEVVLKCGKASITLTRAGKVLIRGAYVLSRSSGVNRIKGGSVQVN